MEYDVKNYVWAYGKTLIYYKFNFLIASIINVDLQELLPITKIFLEFFLLIISINTPNFYLYCVFGSMNYC